MDDAETCSNPGCDQPGTNKCSACKTTHYCGPICQTADWPHHREQCPGHLRKMGMAHLEKAWAFDRERNRLQTLRYADLALTKLKQLKDRSLAFVDILDDALSCKYNALNFMCREEEALKCATEKYNMWATTYMRNPRTIEASFPLIASLIHNKEFAQAQLIARTVYEMTMHPMTHDIPADLQQPLLAKAAYYLADAIHSLAQAGGIPPEEKQKVGEETIALARKALGIHTLLYGAESEQVVNDMGSLARILVYFNNDDDDEEAIRLYKQEIAINSRMEGSTTVNMAVNLFNLGNAYHKRVHSAVAANDLDRCLVNLELALSNNRESARIFGAINLMDKAKEATEIANNMEECIAEIRIRIAARAIAAAATRG